MDMLYISVSLKEVGIGVRGAQALTAALQRMPSIIQLRYVDRYPPLAFS